MPSLGKWSATTKKSIDLSLESSADQKSMQTDSQEAEIAMEMRLVASGFGALLTKHLLHL